MRNYSNQNSGKPSGNRGGYGRSGGYNRDRRDGREKRDGREGRGGDYRGGNRYERGEQRRGGGNYRPVSRSSEYRREERPERSKTPFTPRTGGSWIEVEGRTAEEAIEEACRRFNVNAGDLITEVLDEGSKGFLGIGSKPSKVKVSLKPSAVLPFAEGVLSRLLRGMCLPDQVKSRKDSDGNSVLNIQGPSSGTLIGRHGHTLEAMQYLVSKVVQRMTGDEKTMVIVDVENYLERQREKLQELAKNLAQKAKETGVEIPMRPMSSKDRRVVHLALKDHEHVTTESRGEGLRRKVVIVPKVKAPEGAATPAPTEAPAEPAAQAEPVAPEQGNTVAVETPAPAPVPAASEGAAQASAEPGNAAPPPAADPDDNIGNH